MTRICILFIISFTACVAQTDSLLWKRYVRGGGAQAEKDRGVFGYYRINRQTPFTFRDLRLFGYGLEKESFISVSNVALICPHCQSPARVIKSTLGDGSKGRSCKRCKEVIE